VAGGSTGLVVEERDLLDDATTSAVLALVERCAEADSVRPISEHSWLHIRQGGDHGSVHLLATSGGALAGYAHLDVTDAIEGPSVELAVDPDQRRIGIGQALLERAIARSPGGRLRMWAHGENTGTDGLAERMGFARVRTLWQMRRSLFSPLARAELPAGVVIAPFRVGVDEDAWLSVNARAFVDLADQGGWTRADLDLRLGEPWFSPEGFLLAWRGDELVGFHWTKIHAGPHEPIGEVYVVGVDPSARGTGLGRALTLAGLHHLRSQGLAWAMLYVDAANVPAIGLYEHLGFARWDTDVLFRR
jgi:mycothiol synthase